MWREGSIRVEGQTFHYFIKVYETGSEFGINGGRISKMMLKRNGQTVLNYDRGWDMEPADENTKTAMQILLKENS